MSIHGHIKQLRTRLFLVAAAFAIFGSLAYVLRQPLIDMLLAPLDGERLAYLTPGGGFSFIFKVSMWFGIAATLPFAVFAIYTFISPALPKKAQRYAPIVLVASALLLVAGAAFGYFFAIPGAMRFLLGFASQYIQAMLTADSYLNFVLTYTLGFGILFQIPLLIIIINWITPLKPRKLLKFERYVILIAFTLAAFITPTPDIVNQTIMAAPIIIMYQIGVVAVSLSAFRQSRREKRLTKKSKTTSGRLEAPMAAIPLISTLIEPDVVTAVPMRSSQPRLVNDMTVAKHHSVVQPKPSTVIRPQPRAVQPLKAQHGRSVDGVVRRPVQPRQPKMLDNYGRSAYA